MAWRKWGLGLLTMAYPLVIYFGLQHYSPRVMALALVVLALLRAATSRQTGWRVTALLAAALAIAVLASDHELPLKLYPVLVNVAMLARCLVSLGTIPIKARVKVSFRLLPVKK